MLGLCLHEQPRAHLTPCRQGCVQRLGQVPCSEHQRTELHHRLLEPFLHGEVRGSGTSGRVTVVLTARETVRKDTVRPETRAEVQTRQRAQLPEPGQTKPLEETDEVCGQTRNLGERTHTDRGERNGGSAHTRFDEYRPAGADGLPRRNRCSEAAVCNTDTDAVHEPDEFAERAGNQLLYACRQRFVTAAPPGRTARAEQHRSCARYLHHRDELRKRAHHGLETAGIARRVVLNDHD